MQNGNGNHPLDEIIDALNRHSAILEVVCRHLAIVEASVGLLATQTLPQGEKRESAKKVRDIMAEKIYDRMIADAQENFPKPADEA